MIEVEEAIDEVALADEFDEPLAGSQPGGVQSTGGGLLPLISVGQPESTPSGHVASETVCLLFIAALFRLLGLRPFGVDCCMFQTAGGPEFRDHIWLLTKLFTRPAVPPVAVRAGYSDMKYAQRPATVGAAYDVPSSLTMVSPVPLAHSMPNSPSSEPGALISMSGPPCEYSVLNPSASTAPTMIKSVNVDARSAGYSLTSSAPFGCFCVDD